MLGPARELADAVCAMGSMELPPPPPCNFHEMLNDIFDCDFCALFIQIYYILSADLLN